MTSALDEKISAILSWNIIMSPQKKKPIIVDCTTETLVANFAASPFTAPSSLATLTLDVSWKLSETFTSEPFSK